MNSIILHKHEVFSLQRNKQGWIWREIKPQPSSVEFWKQGKPCKPEECNHPLLRDDKGTGWLEGGPFERPYKTGDRLWVKESCRPDLKNGRKAAMRELPQNTPIIYRADVDAVKGEHKWSKPIHMMRWMSRFTIEVTSLEIEQVPVKNYNPWMWKIGYKVL